MATSTPKEKAAELIESYGNMLAEIVFRVAREYSAQTGLVEVSKNGNKCYVADVSNKDPKTIARMNYSLAEAVCMEPELDDCELIARFSSPRTLHTRLKSAKAS